MEGREESWCILTITPAAHRHQHHETACKRTSLQTEIFSIACQLWFHKEVWGKGRFFLYFWWTSSSYSWTWGMPPYHNFFTSPCYACTFTHRHTHTHTNKHTFLICIWDLDYRGILFINLVRPVLPGQSLQSTNFPLPPLLCLPVEKLSKPYLQIFLPLGPLPNAVCC